jgi:hypothetical protein
MISLFHGHRRLYHCLTGREYSRAALHSEFVTSGFQLGIANQSGLVKIDAVASRCAGYSECNGPQAEHQSY